MFDLSAYNIVPLKNSPYIQEVFDHIDKWKCFPQNRNSLTEEGDLPMHMWSTCRPPADEYNEIMDTPFQYKDTSELICRHFVGLDKNNKVISYFHFNETSVPVFVMNIYCGVYDSAPSGVVQGATCVHCYNFSGGTFAFGKQQSAFYEYCTQEYDYVSVLIEAEGPWTCGDVLVDGTPTSDSYKAITKQRLAETGFAHDGMLTRCQKYNGVLTPYCANIKTMDGQNRFHHMIQWRGPSGIQKGLAQFPVQIERPYELPKALYDAGITEYY